MGRYVAGRSIYENCGAYVIVEEARLEGLEDAARIIRDLLGRASRATTIAEMGALLDQLPVGSPPDWQVIAEEEFEVSDFDEAPPERMYERCVEEYFYSSATETYDSTLVFDTTACYSDVLCGDPTVRAALRPFIDTARHDPDAGLDDLDGAMRALQAAGHPCARDDTRIRRVFGYLMTDAYLRAEERP